MVVLLFEAFWRSCVGPIGHCSRREEIRAPGKRRATSHGYGGAWRLQYFIGISVGYERSRRTRAGHVSRVTDDGGSIFERTPSKRSNPNGGDCADTQQAERNRR